MRIIRGDPLRDNPFADAPADYAIICSDAKKLIRNAGRLRRFGQSVYTQFSGKRKAQLKRAVANAWRVIDFDNHDGFSVYPYATPYDHATIASFRLSLIAGGHLVAIGNNS